VDAPEPDPNEVDVPSDDRSSPIWYANNFEVGHNAFEFMIAFGFAHEDAVVWHGRVVSGPVPAKLLHDLLGRALEEYERAFGPVTPTEPY
jgi:hypothetical protein